MFYNTKLICFPFFTLFLAPKNHTNVKKIAKTLCFTIENHFFFVFSAFSDFQKNFLRTTWLPASCSQPSASPFQRPAYGFRLPAPGVGLMLGVCCSWKFLQEIKKAEKTKKNQFSIVKHCILAVFLTFL